MTDDYSGVVYYVYKKVVSAISAYSAHSAINFIFAPLRQSCAGLRNVSRILRCHTVHRKEIIMRFRVSLLLIIVVSFAAPALAQKRNITEKDLFNFVWIGDPQVSPDGSRVAFVRVTVNDKKDGYNTAIWTVATATGETRQLTNGPRDTTPRWSPDGKYLVFVRAPEVSGRVEPAQLFMLAMAGGEPFQFTTLPRGAGGPQWSPDGKMIAFYNSATPEETRESSSAKHYQLNQVSRVRSPTPSPNAKATCA